MSVVRNYLYKVVGGKHVGQHIVLQGGVAYNAGIIAAFKSYYGERITVSPWFAVSGALGIALLTLENRHRKSAADIPDVQFELLNKTKELFLKDYQPPHDPAKMVVGIPRCLTMYKLFPMANAFFREL